MWYTVYLGDLHTILFTYPALVIILLMIPITTLHITTEEHLVQDAPILHIPDLNICVQNVLVNSPLKLTAVRPDSACRLASATDHKRPMTSFHGSVCSTGV